MIVQNRTFSVALTRTQGQTRKKAHKILISQIALKLHWLLSTSYSHIWRRRSIHVKLFLGLELVLVITRVGAKFRLWLWSTLSLKLTLTIPNLFWCFDVRFVTSDVIATGRKYWYRFATGGKLILFKHILLSSILANNRAIVIENK